MNIPGPRPMVTPIDRGEWEPEAIYLIGDAVWDTYVPSEVTDGDFPTPAGRFRCLVDHRAGYLGPRCLEVDEPGVWERLS